MLFDRIMPAVASGEVEAGVIIHEGRFTFRPTAFGWSSILASGGRRDRTSLPLAR